MTHRQLMALLERRPRIATGRTVVGGRRTLGLVRQNVAFAIGVDYLFERKSVTHWLINAGHFVVTFVVMGAIIGAWR